MVLIRCATSLFSILRLSRPDTAKTTPSSLEDEAGEPKPPGPAVPVARGGVQLDVDCVSLQRNSVYLDLDDER